jgi:hypothetical protein
VRGLEREEGARVAVQVVALAALRGRRLDGELVAHQPLRVGGQRLQVGKVLRRLDRRRVLVARFVGDVEKHGAAVC